ncbi:MAG: ribbon-helix-helix protein, CopG family [Desulfurococcales archaeon]|nr:ribbon-helix-helix protein, CopG family [Desulfurococcales archaeon]
MPIVSISIPDDLLLKIDRLARQLGFPSRSDLVRQALKEYVEAHEGSAGYDYVVFMVLSDHGVGKNIDQRILDVIHRHRAIVRSFYHCVIEGSKCLTYFVVKPENPEEASQLASQLRRLKGVMGVWRLNVEVEEKSESR